MGKDVYLHIHRREYGCCFNVSLTDFKLKLVENFIPRVVMDICVLGGGFLGASS